MHGLGTNVTICNYPAYALRRRSCNGMFSGAVYILILIVMSFALASYMEVSFIVNLIIDWLTDWLIDEVRSFDMNQVQTYIDRI